MIPSGLKDAWESAEKQIDAGEYDDALKTLRESWSEHGDKADHANTWTLVGDAKQALAEGSTPINRKMLRDANNSYQSALKKDPKHRNARRASNALQAKMDGLGIRTSSLPKLIDDGTPTIYGLFSIMLVGMLILTSIKYMPEIKAALRLTSEESSDWDATLAIELYPQSAPKAVESFQDHSRNGRYDGIAFHRVIDDFMVQGGDISCSAYPLTQSSTSCNPGTGGYSAFWYGQGDQNDMTTWTMPDEFNSAYRHGPGILSMANSGANTGGSQFFIVDKDSTPSHLDDKHSVFGIVTDDSTYLGSDIGGIELVDRMSILPVDEGDRPLNPPYIHSIEIDGNMAYMHLIFP